MADAGEGFAEVVVACGVAEADVAGSAECGAVDGGDVCLLEQVHGEVAGCGDHFISEALAEYSGHFGEEVERALGLVNLKARDL